jgi:hypothetical protein
VDRLKNRPFALLGVNFNGYDVAQLGTAIERNRLTWRSFADPGPIGGGAITRRWCIAMTPTVFLLDANGVIRGKWVGNPDAAAIDDLIERMLKEAERK